MSNLISTLPLAQREIFQSFQISNKATSPDCLMKEILSWTGNNILLTKYICQIIVEANYFIPSGMEAILIEKLVQEQLIENWHHQSLKNQSLVAYFTQIQAYFFTQSEFYARTLLLTYLDIWQQGKVLSYHSQETEQLITLGLVIEQENYLQVSNRLYQLIFDDEWVQQQLFAIKLMNATPSQQAQTKTPKKTFSFNLSTFTLQKNNPFYQIVMIISWSGLGLIVSLILFSIFQTQFITDIEIDNSRFEKQF